MDKPAGDLLLTKPRVVWEYTYSDQWEPEQDNQTDPRQPITGFKIGYGGWKKWLIGLSAHAGAKNWKWKKNFILFTMEDNLKKI